MAFVSLTDQIDRVEAEYVSLKAMHAALLNVIFSDKLLEDPETFQKKLSDFENGVVASSSLLQALMAREQAGVGVSGQPGQGQLGQAQLPQSPKLGMVHVGLVAIIFGLMFVGVYLRYVPAEMFGYVAVFAIGAMALPLMLPFLASKMPKLPAKDEDEPKTRAEWIGKQIAEMRRRYASEYWLVRLQRSIPSQMPELDDFSVEVKDRKLQRLMELRHDFPTTLGRIMVLVNEAVREQVNYLNECMVRTEAAAMPQRPIGGGGP